MPNLVRISYEQYKQMQKRSGTPAQERRARAEGFANWAQRRYYLSQIDTGVRPEDIRLTDPEPVVKPEEVRQTRTFWGRTKKFWGLMLL